MSQELIKHEPGCVCVGHTISEVKLAPMKLVWRCVDACPAKDTVLQEASVQERIIPYESAGFFQ
jgi:hypothetical protein